MTREEESRLIAQVQDGDAAAFETLVLENQKFVYNLALKMAGHEEDALDIAQEAFLKAYTAIKTFRGESRFSVWLYKITYNIAIDWKRKRAKEAFSSTTYLDEEGEPIELEIPDERYSPTSMAEKRELAAALEKAVEQLGPEHRQIFLLRELSGMAYEEIALALAINEGTVKSRLSRARQHLAKILIKQGTFDPPNRPKKQKGGQNE